MDFSKFQSLLDEQISFPDYYQFKFVIKEEEKQPLLDLLAGHKIEQKHSKNGNYVSISSRKLFQNSDEIVAVYREVSKIKGIITL